MNIIFDDLLRFAHRQLSFAGEAALATCFGQQPVAERTAGDLLASAKEAFDMTGNNVQIHGSLLAGDRKTLHLPRMVARLLLCAYQTPTLYFVGQADQPHLQTVLLRFLRGNQRNADSLIESRRIQ